MSQFNSNSSTLEELYAQVIGLLDQAVSRAFLHYRHHPTPEDVARFHQRLSLLLLENDYHRLREIVSKVVEIGFSHYSSKPCEFIPVTSLARISPRR
jgi:DNA-binding FadR family transcriptional regulator